MDYCVSYWVDDAGMLGRCYLGWGVVGGGILIFYLAFGFIDTYIVPFWGRGGDGDGDLVPRLRWWEWARGARSLCLDSLVRSG